MDLEDPYVDPEIDQFSLIFPLPYRVAIIVVLGVWAWGANLHYLSAVKIDVPALIRYPSRASHLAASHHLSTYRLGVILSIPLGFSILLYWIITHGDARIVLQWEILPNLYLLILVLLFVIPSQYISSRSGRHRTLTTLQRVSIGGLAEVQDGKFGDILMADVLTSYAKVMGDLFIALCMLVTGQHTTAHPDRTCGGVFLVPFIISIPFLIRFRQCLIEYSRVRKAISVGPNPNLGWGGVHLGNALKYATAFPVIILSSLQRDYEYVNSIVSEAFLFRIWLFAAFANSFYSFYWDVAKDWDLSLFSASRADPEHPWGLRKHRYFHANNLYYSAIFMDLLLRCTWSFKLSPHLDHFNDLEGGIFVMEFLEVFRRWIWVFFRVETEWVRNNRGPATDDVLLGEFTERFVDD